jgi:hypothetical protein
MPDVVGWTIWMWGTKPNQVVTVCNPPFQEFSPIHTYIVESDDSDDQANKPKAKKSKGKKAAKRKETPLSKTVQEISG